MGVGGEWGYEEIAFPLLPPSLLTIHSTSVVNYVKLFTQMKNSLLMIINELSELNIVTSWHRQSHATFIFTQFKLPERTREGKIFL